MSDDAKARSSAASLPEAKFKVDDPVLMTTQRGIGRVASVLAPVAFPGLRNVRYGVLLPNLDPEPCLFEEHELTGVTGRWVHCSPELLASGVDCGTTPRSVCRCPFDGSHDHLVSEERADRPASPTPASDYDAGLATAERIVRSLAKHNADRSKDSRDVRGLIAGALYAAADDIGSAIFTHPQHPQEARPTSAKPDETRRYRALLAEAALLLRDTDPDSAEHAVRLAKTIDKTLRAEQARLKENE